jgi:putative DNA primase/helicase
MSVAVQRIIAALSARDCRPRPSGEGWLARCPAHDDRKPSLSVSEGDSGRALLKCHTGCSHEQVVRALGLEVRDLFDDAVQPALATVAKGGKSHAKTFPTWEAAIPKPLGAPSRHWEYEDASGTLVGIAARWDCTDGSKTFRPFCLTAHGWRAKAMAEPRPLYRLPAVIAAGNAIVVVEGEKCVDALGGVGIVATTSSMGAEAARKSDWSPLAGRHVVILPDNDAAGSKYASEVSRLAQVAGAKSVSLARLADHWPACPAGGDIADWIEARGDAAEPATIRDEIEKILATARPVEGINDAPAEALASQSLPAGAANLGQPATQTDAGLCKRLCHAGQGRFLWVSERKTWARWDDRRWVDDPDGGEPRRVSKAIAAALWKELTAQSPLSLVKFCRDAASRRGIDAAAALAKSEPGIEAAADSFDADPYAINCDNGILDLRTMALRPHDPGERMTKLVPVPFDAKAECPRWMAFLSEVMLGDEEMVGYLQRSIGLALSGDVSEQILSVHWGDGCNGKSLFFSVLGKIFGDYAAPIPADILVTANGERDREKSVSRLVGRRLCYAQEPDDGGKLAEGSLKAITGGDRLTARVEWERARVVTPTWHIHVCMNQLPQVRGTDYGLWRRLHIVRWGRTFGPEEQRPRAEIERELVAEAPGILRWLCDGFTAWREGGLRPPQSVANVTERYRQFSDSVSRWLASEEVAREEGVETPAGELYAAYSRFCRDEGCHSVSQAMFGRSLEARGITKNRPKAGPWRDTTVRVGLRLTTSHPRLTSVGA